MNREQRKAIINSYVEAFLDSLEENFDDEEDEIGVVCIVAEMSFFDGDDDRRTALPYFCSDERKFVQYGMMRLAAEQARDSYEGDDDEETA